MKRFGAAAIVGGLVLLGLALVLIVLGKSPLAVLRALIEGSIASQAGLEATFKRATPLLLCGLAVTVAFRAGAWNLGAEGQLVAGALAATWAALFLPAFAGPLLALVTACVAGAAFGLLAAWLREKRGVPDVLATIFLNFVALGLSAFAVDEGGPLREASGGYPRSDELPVATHLPWIRLAGFGRAFHLGFPLAVLLAVVLELTLIRTRTGLGLRATGARREVAHAAGFRPDRFVLLALALGGACAGLAGGVEVTGVTHRLFRQVSGGLGYTAIAVALIGRLRPLGVVVAALAFGALEAGSMAAQRQADVSSVLAQLLEGVVLLAAIGLGPGLEWLARRDTTVVST